jgi:hypothetical protein
MRVLSNLTIKRLCHHHSKTNLCKHSHNQINNTKEQIDEMNMKLTTMNKEITKEINKLHDELGYVYIIQIFTIPLFICWNF